MLKVASVATGLRTIPWVSPWGFANSAAKRGSTSKVYQTDPLFNGTSLLRVQQLSAGPVRGRITDTTLQRRPQRLNTSDVAHRMSGTNAWATQNACRHHDYACPYCNREVSATFGIKVSSLQGKSNIQFINVRAATDRLLRSAIVMGRQLTASFQSPRTGSRFQ